jgi:poly(3-hydroxybutyrate) depolymerase
MPAAVPQPTTSCVLSALTLTLALTAPNVAHAAWESRSIAGMSVEIYTPESTSPIGSGRGLLIGLHGCIQTAAQLRDYAVLETAADDFGMVIALPLVPDGGVVAGCWDYYGADHSRSDGPSGALVELTESLRDDAGYEVDPAQIYVAGLSSGGGEALVVGCLAPDLFAGVGVIAGPSVGTTSLQIGAVATTAEQAATVCTALADTHNADFATQLAVTFTDTSDFTVAQGYAQINADMFASLYGGGLQQSAFDMASLAGSMPAGMGTRYDDDDGGRVSALHSTSGTGHNWPSGSGTNGPALSYVSGNGVDFAYHLADFFTANARRVDDGEGSSDDGGSGEAGSTDAASDDGVGSSGEEAGDGDSAASTQAGDDDGGADGSSGADGADGSTSTGAAQDDDADGASGCQCSHGERRDPPWLAALVMLALARRRACHIVKM